MPTREKGVATAPCPSCGKDLPLVQQADGSMATEACPKCHRPPTKKAEKAAADSLPSRETGTDTEES